MQGEFTEREIGRLRRCMNDLVSVLALPAMWTGHDLSSVASILLNGLVRILDLDFGYLRTCDFGGGPPKEWIRLGEEDAPANEIGRALAPYLTQGSSKTSQRIANPVADGMVSISVCHLGIQESIGVFVAGSRRPEFPTESDRLLLQVATNQVVIALQEARRIAELETMNKELEAFAYSVSHDLRAPLRHMSGYSELLQKKAPSIQLDEACRRYITIIVESAKRMGNLIDDLLAFSRIARTETQKSLVNLSQLVTEATSDVRQETEGRNIEWKIGALPEVHGDRSMLRLVLVNLLSNSVKFTRPRPQAEIEIGCVNGNSGEVVVFIRDNGVGFDMKYVKRLFGVFQRLHQSDAFEGTGIGLATVQRIIHRHAGKVWAEGALDQGATFYFSLPR